MRSPSFFADNPPHTAPHPATILATGTRDAPTTTHTTTTTTHTTTMSNTTNASNWKSTNVVLPYATIDEIDYSDSDVVLVQLKGGGTLQAFLRRTYADGDIGSYEWFDAADEGESLGDYNLEVTHWMDVPEVEAVMSEARKHRELADMVLEQIKEYSLSKWDGSQSPLKVGLARDAMAGIVKYAQDLGLLED